MQVIIIKINKIIYEFSLFCSVVYISNRFRIKIMKPLIANEFFLCQLAHPIPFYSGLLSSSAPFHLWKKQNDCPTFIHPKSGIYMLL